MNGPAFKLYSNAHTHTNIPGDKEKPTGDLRAPPADDERPAAEDDSKSLNDIGPRDEKTEISVKRFDWLIFHRISLFEVLTAQ
jgi:hypothetical protein